MTIPTENPQASSEKVPGFRPAFTGFFLTAYILWVLIVLGWIAFQPDLGGPFFSLAKPFPLNILFDTLGLFILLNAGIASLAASTTAHSLEWFALFGLALATYQALLGGVETGLGALLFSVLALTFALALQGSTR